MRQGRVRTRREEVSRFWEQLLVCGSVEQAATRAGIAAATGRTIVHQAGGVRPRLKEPSGRYLSFRERELIALWRGGGSGVREIARWLGRDPGTVSRELARNGRSHSRGPASGRGPRQVPYLASVAQDRAERAGARPKPRKLAGNPRLARCVRKKLAKRWSPEQVSAWLTRRYPHDRSMQVSHETIYQSLYVQGRGGLNRELVTALRTGRAVRKPRRREGQRRARVPAELLISQRPAEAEDRAVPGHWEGDLILGKDGASAIGTLVERTTRFTMLLHLPGAHDALAVRDAMGRAIPALPRQLWRSLTWDQGSEMVGAHLQIRIEDGLPIYFCDPHSPWQRGSNENTNGLLRQYFPKGTNLSVHTVEHLTAVAAELNGRPRKTLGWDTPAQALAKLLSPPQATGVATTP
ncbi:integrase [Intrasporangium oryzae NRRL B-24470]|uniref:Integrase n=1 Tax=Intrasporangium oryzae NRRL B-24470 TaxID=1386089 RepID=W9GFF1_9MICO|nr:integrase [Intrasporangium oryzae NRRL B-24470]